MANSTTKPVEEMVAVEKSAATVDNATDENITEKKTSTKNKRTKKVVEEAVEQEPLTDATEIEVISMIPNVFYYDKETYDMISWEEPNHVEWITFEMLKRMWRGGKGYFKNMWLRPLDERVIKKFNLGATYQKYDYLMDASNYTMKNVEEICKTISSITDSSRDLKFFIFNKIRNMVACGEVANVQVIKALEKNLNTQLIEW